MPLALPDKWVWDFWLAEHAGLHHLFYLQAPRSIVDPDLRHWNVSVGHAVSSDMIHWEIRPDALAPSKHEAWDDYTTWTGSIIEHDGLWHMFYTGTSRAEAGMVQRVGVAVSSDLDHWERCDGPLIEADPRWYEHLEPDWHDVAWRDPWVFADESGLFHVFITARTRTGDRFDRGCIAHAKSRDLRSWEVCPPVTTPGGFGQLEVPQLLRHDDTWFLVFCSDIETQDETRREQGEGTGTYYAVGTGPLGPFDAADSVAIQADADGRTYAGRIVDRNGDGPAFLAWRRTGEDGRFVGEIADPISVRAVDASLRLTDADR